MTHILVSVGSERSRSDRPITGAPAWTLTRRHLVGVAEVAPDRVDPEPRLDHPGDVGRGLAHLLDRVGDPQHARHALRVLGAPRREHRDLPRPAKVRVHALVEAFDLPRASRR